MYEAKVVNSNYLAFLVQEPKIDFTEKGMKIAAGGSSTSVFEERST